MIRFLLIVLSVAIGSAAEARSRESMPGATEMEREIRWIWKYVKDFSVSCLESGTDCQDPDVHQVLTELTSYLPDYDSTDYTKWANLLSFISESDHPGIFKSDAGEVHRVSMTGLVKYSPVYINVDLMNLPVDEWVGFLIHESVHHLGYLDDERRIPDRVGAAVASHFLARIQQSNFDQFNRPDVHTLVFNSKANRMSVGLFSWTDQTYDIDWVSSDGPPPCQPGETAVREFVGTPVWRTDRFRVKLGMVSIHGGGYVNVECTNASGAMRVARSLIAGNLDLQFAAPLNFATWLNETPALVAETLALGPSSIPAEVIWGPNQSFAVVSMKDDSSNLKPGDKWHRQITVKSMDGYAPKKCEVYFTGLNWSFWKQIDLPAPAITDTCTLTAMPNNQWKLDMTFAFPANMQSDDFYVYLVRFVDPAGDRYAMPSQLQFVHVDNSQGAKRAEITGWQVKGLTPLTTFIGDQLTSSYQAATGQEFQVVISIAGDQTIGNVQVDLDFWSRVEGGYGRLFYNGPALEMSQIFESVGLAKGSGNTTVTLKVKMLSSLIGIPVDVMRFSRFYMQTSDFSWVEVEIPNQDTGLIVNSSAVK